MKKKNFAFLKIIENEHFDFFQIFINAKCLIKINKFTIFNIN